MLPARPGVGRGVGGVHRQYLTQFGAEVGTLVGTLVGKGYSGKKVVNGQSLVFCRLRSSSCGIGLFQGDTHSGAYRYARSDARSYGYVRSHCDAGAECGLPLEDGVAGCYVLVLFLNLRLQLRFGCGASFQSPVIPGFEVVVEGG